MSPKEREIQLIAEAMKGKRVKIFGKTCGHMVTGDIVKCIGSSLELNNVVWWNGDKQSYHLYSTDRISKIELE